MTLPPIPVTRIQPVGKWLHQRRAFWFAFDKAASMLAVTMGGGKTKTAIDLMLNWKARDVLIIAPQKAIDDAWAPGLEQHMVGEYAVAQLDKQSIKLRTDAASWLMGADESDHRVVVINWEAFWREPFRTWALGRRWDLIVADESHRGKGAGSKQSRCLTLLGKRAARRLCLTGTPMPHSPLDVYGQFRFLDPTIFGTNVSKFRNEYAEFGGWEGRVITGFKNLDHLREKFSSIAIQIDDSEQGLPETVDITHSVDLEPEARRIYNVLDKEFTVEVGRRDITAANAGVKLMRLHEMASGHAVYLGDRKPGTKKRERMVTQISTAKLEGLRDVLEDIKKDEPLVIFVRFSADIGTVYDLMVELGRSVTELSGQVNGLQSWKAGKANVLVAQIQAAKEGIDLTRAAVAIFYSTGISLGDYLQCRKRLHRPPQKRMVRFIHLLSRGTRDITTMRALRDRKDVIREALRG